MWLEAAWALGVRRFAMGLDLGSVLMADSANRDGAVGRIAPLLVASERGQGRAALFAARRSAPLTPWRGTYAQEWLWARYLGAYSHDGRSVAVVQ